MVKSLKALFVRGVAVDKELMEASAREWVGMSTRIRYGIPC